MTFIEVLSGFALPHALVGTVALVTFWTAGWAKKGSPLHKRAGKIYMIAMLAYLVILVSHACRSAWLAIRYKRDFARYTGTGSRISAGLLSLSGIVVVIIGVQFGAWLLIMFGLIGPVTGWGALQLIRKGPSSPKWWLKEHYGAMIGNGVATHIAFLQIGLMRLVPELGFSAVQHLAWFGPLTAGILAGFWLNRRYMTRRQPVTPSTSAATL